MNTEEHLETIRQMLKERFLASDYEELLEYTAKLYLNLGTTVRLAKDINKSYQELIEIANKNDELIAHARNELKEVIVQHKVGRAEYALKFSSALDKVSKEISKRIKELPAKVRKESARNAGKVSKNRAGKEQAEEIYKSWADDPTMFKNQAAFLRALQEKRTCGQYTKPPICKTNGTAKNWLYEFRIKCPCPALEKLLPPMKKKESY